MHDTPDVLLSLPAIPDVLALASALSAKARRCRVDASIPFVREALQFVCPITERWKIRFRDVAWNARCMGEIGDLLTAGGLPHFLQNEGQTKEKYHEKVRTD
jgi:hypothetical protein